jgi:hypothetical protein
MDIPLSFIHAGQVTPDVLALFDINRPTMPRAFSVLEGLEPRGQASQRWTGAATAGALRMMVGGEADVLDRARPVLEASTSQIYPMGPNGTGTLMNAGQI